MKCRERGNQTTWMDEKRMDATEREAQQQNHLDGLKAPGCNGERGATTKPPG